MTLGVEARKRLTIGVELASRPSALLFLDEPTSGLDAQSAFNLVRFLRKLAAAGQVSPPFPRAEGSAFELTHLSSVYHLYHPSAFGPPLREFRPPAPTRARRRDRLLRRHRPGQPGTPRLPGTQRGGVPTGCESGGVHAGGYWSGKFEARRTEGLEGHLGGLS